jgi:hypothetical protein
LAVGVETGCCLAIKYRDPKTGHFISKRSASRRTKNLPITERYNDTGIKKGKKNDDFVGFISDQEEFTEQIENVLNSVLPPPFVDFVLEDKPNLTIEQVIAIAVKEDIDFNEEDLRDFILGFDLDIDLDKYLK